MKLLAIVQANLVRAARDRTALFFSTLLPLMLILVLGLSNGSGGSGRLGVVDQDGGEFGTQLLAGIDTATDLALDIRRFDTVDALRDAAARGLVEVGLVVPAGASQAVAVGRDTAVTIVATDTGTGNALATTVEDAVAREAAIVRAARFAVSRNGGSITDALAAARAAAATVPGVAVAVEPVNAAIATAGGTYASGATSQLVLFMFLTSLTGATELVLTRQLGVSRRMFGTPTSMATIVIGESLARIAFALAQGLFIVVASSVLFGVRWGDLAGTSLIVVVFAAVSGGAAMLIGGLARNPSQAGALGPALGMLLGLFGGAMVPIEVFPAAMQTLAHLTPHAWAMDALGRLGEPGAGIASVLPQLAALAVFAVALFGLATVRFRRVLQAGA
jgi:ABC-2 type transport system permease protein